MRRHMTMEQLARDVLQAAATAKQEKTASAVQAKGSLNTEMAQLLSKVASEVRNYNSQELTYADVAAVAEARRGQR